MDFEFPYAKPSIEAADKQAVYDALGEARLTRGPITERFERAIGDMVGARFVVAFNSGTSALWAAANAAHISAADHIITTPNSFIATIAPALSCGAHLRFVDIDRSSGNMDVQAAKELLRQPRSRGRTVIMPVHFAGIAVDMKKLTGALVDPDAVIIEDAAHALGSFYPSGEPVGSSAYSQMTVFSFHPAKTITTGEGGCVTTNDEQFYHRLKLYRNNALIREKPDLEREPASGYYEIHELGMNMHMTEMQAALGLAQLTRLPLFKNKRRSLVQRYRERLQRHPHITLFDEAFDTRSVYHLFCVQIDFTKMGIERAAFMQKLREAGIGTDVHYIPLYQHHVIKQKYGDQTASFPHMEAYYSQTLTLPLYYDLTEENIDYITNVICNFPTENRI